MMTCLDLKITVLAENQEYAVQVIVAVIEVGGEALKMKTLVEMYDELGKTTGIEPLKVKYDVLAKNTND